MAEREMLDTTTLRVFILAPVVFAWLMLRPLSTYGKLHRTEDSWFGMMLPAPMSWFLFESPNLIWSVYGYLHRDETIFRMSNCILLAAFTLHYINRTLLYPLKMSPKSKTPIGITLSGMCYTTVNGYLQAQSLCQFQSYPDRYEYSPRFVLGVFVMALGFVINYTSDSELCRLRSLNEGYQIPRGGLFEHVSTPHFGGEMLEWVGYAIAARCWAAWSFPVWTAANLIPRALRQHCWYREKFKDYPKERKAFIPSIL